LAGQEDLLRARGFVYADTRLSGRAEVAAVELVVEWIPEGGLAVLVERDASGAAVLDDEHPVGPVPILAREFLVRSAPKPRDDGGEQAGQVLDTSMM